MSDVTANKALVRQFMEAFSKGDIDLWATMLADDATYEIMGTSTVSGKRSKAQILQESRGLLAMFPQGLQIHVRGLTAEGDRVALEAWSDATSASGFAYQNTYHMLFIIRGGRVHEAREYLDTRMIDRMLAGA